MGDVRYEASQDALREVIMELTQAVIDAECTRQQVAELNAATKKLTDHVTALRAAVRAADAVFASQDHSVFAKGEERALAEWREARAKCGEVT